MQVKTKICGVNTTAAASESVRGGANFIGFVFYPPSPRYVTAKKAAEISTHIPPNIINVGVFVNPEDDELDLITNSVSLSMIQLHGSESPERVSEIRTHTGLSVMKAISIETYIWKEPCILFMIVKLCKHLRNYGADVQIIYIN